LVAMVCARCRPSLSFLTAKSPTAVLLIR
jgi:hypothetical protein